MNPEGPCAADSAFWRGRTLYAARQPLLAMTWFIAASKRHPDDADTYRWLAAAAYDLGNRQTAVSALETVTRLEPRDARAWRTLGLIFKESVEYERARDALEKSLSINGSQPGVRLDLAEARLKLGDVAGAERELASCQGQVPEGRRAELLAECRRIRGDLAGLRAAVAAGLAAAPRHPGLLVQRAQIDLADSRPAEALASLDRAVAADPYRPEAIYLRGVVLRRLGRTEQARRDLARAEELNKGLAEMSALNGRAERAPHDADIRCRLGRLCVELGKLELAASWYRAALACDPNHAEARLGLNALRPRNRAGTGP
jgi:Flp pilus assembly protein TadD